MEKLTVKKEGYPIRRKTNYALYKGQKGVIRVSDMSGFFRRLFGFKKPEEPKGKIGRKEAEAAKKETSEEKEKLEGKKKERPEKKKTQQRKRRQTRRKTRTRMKETKV